jgi:hypothetical protein
MIKTHTKVFAYMVTELSGLYVLCFCCSLDFEAVFVCASKKADVLIWSGKSGMSGKDIRCHQCIEVANMRHWSQGQSEIVLEVA